MFFVYRFGPAFCFVLLALGMWLSSGNLTPYAATLPRPNHTDIQGNLLDSATAAQRAEQGERIYIVNYDHLLYHANYLMLKGEDFKYWHFNVVQRRILYYVLALPFMKLFGFHWGGFITTLLITLASVFYAYRYVKRSYGEPSGLLFLLLMCTYPGIMYWCGTSFAQVIIVPLCLVFFIQLRQYVEDPSNRRAWILTAVFGIGFLGYDLLAFFVPAVLLLFVYTKRWKHLLLIPLMLLPSFLLNVYYRNIGMPLINNNTETYRNIIYSYGDMTGEIFLRNLSLMPETLYYNYIDSQFWALGWLGLFVLLLTMVSQGFRFSPVSVALTVSMLAVLLFANMAPPYTGPWAIRGQWVARIYQPFFVVVVFAVVSLSAKSANRPWLRGTTVAAVLFAVLFNVAVIFSPALHYFGFVHAYAHFYRHAPTETMEDNIHRYGARPLGF